MGPPRKSMGPSNSGERDDREEFVKLDRFGYVRVRALIRGGTVLYVLLTGIVTVLTSDLITLAFLGLLVVFVLAVRPLEQYLPSERRVSVYTAGGLFIAKHLESGTTRHGTSPEDALANLDGAI